MVNTFSLPLAGLKVVEFGGLAPAPFAGLILADWGAQVIRIDKLPSPDALYTPLDVLARGKRSIAIDIRKPSGLEVAKKLVCQADVLIDPFRPGVMEKLGLGPDVFLGEEGLNKKLIFSRLVGFSRTGMHRDIAGHDLNYLALSGVLSILPGSPDRPTFPLNLLADFAGGGLMCALGIMIALHERSRSGRGQIVDNDMVSATRYLSSFALIQSFIASSPEGDVLPPTVPSSDASSRMQNTLDDGAPFYTVYTCADGKWFSVACIEPKFYKIFLDAFINALPPQSKNAWVPDVEEQHWRESWPTTREFFEKGFKMYNRNYWTKVFEGTDACAVPVLSPQEAAILASTSASPNPHPTLSRTPARPLPEIQWTAPGEQYCLTVGQHTEDILKELGVEGEERARLLREGALGVAEIKRDAKL
ncbi:CoA-transferase family III [Cristinia sonorae]|uniref:CoA-transferase family III n=1 Tax=Cristinia sonorae TaxID=1940300 RepID=A0A8K0UQ66_9AGAR|nr:CoA-transferase family III [Cristinia sonorae]